jgi:2-keto-3-deoxy-L-rhamnonate aldolase RhmA
VEAIAADCDLDWILLDMEHGGAGWEEGKAGLLHIAANDK